MAVTFRNIHSAVRCTLALLTTPLVSVRMRTFVLCLTLASAQALAGGSGTRTPAAVDFDGGLLLSKGVYRPLRNVPGALTTVHLRMNNGGSIVGTYSITPGSPENPVPVSGFLMRGRRVSTIDVPGAFSTVAIGVNDRGQVVGGYVEPGAVIPVGESPTRGYLWKDGELALIDVPDATSTAPYEINNRGQIVGNYADGNRVQHGFILHRGVFTSVDHPLATRRPQQTATRLVGINDAGWVVGSYGDDEGIIHAFVRDPHGELTTIDPPDVAGAAEASNINARGQIVGRFLDATPTLLSFLLKPEWDFVTLDIRGRCDTAALDINDRGEILIAPVGSTDGTTCPQDAMPPLMQGSQ